MKSNKEIKKEMKKVMSIPRSQHLGLSLVTLALGGVSLFLFLLTQFSTLLVSMGLRIGLWGEAAVVMKWVYLGLAIHLILSILVGSTVELGYNRAILLRTREEAIQKGTLFYFFPVWFNAMILRMFLAVKAVLWTMILVVPGIVATFNYALAPYVFAQHPRMNPGDAIKISKHLMKGYKWKLFTLILSFADEIIISILAFGIPFIYVIPRMKAAVAIFYRERVALHNEEVEYLQANLALEG